MTEAALLTEALVALAISSVLSIGAWKRGSLSTSGGLAATAVGFLVWMGTGRVGFAALCGFFLTSTLLGRIGKARKRPLQLDYEKGDRRDALQVFANGGVGAATALVLGVGGDAGPFPGGFATTSDTTWLLAAMASLASANADTWATELGVLWPHPPRSLWSWRRVPAGTSGAVSPAGLVAALGGALVVALITSAADVPVPAIEVVGYVTVAGFLGALFDSALGKAQRQYACEICSKTVEAKTHCERATTLRASRFAVLNNDGVNFLANAAAAVLVLLLR